MRLRTLTLLAATRRRARGAGWLALCCGLACAGVAAGARPTGGPAKVLRERWALTHVTVDASATADGKALDDASVVIEGGVVRCVGVCALPPGIPVHDAQGARLLPGLVEVGSELGLVEVSLEPHSHDGVAGHAENLAHVRARDGLAVDSAVVAAARWGGVLVAVTAPQGGALVAGTAVAFRTAGPGAAAATLIESAGVFVRLGDAGRRDDRPLVGARSGQIAMLRARLRAAAELSAGDAREAVPRGLERSSDREALLALAEVVGGRQPLVVQAHRAEDIAAALELRRLFGLRLIVLGGAEAWLVAAELAAARVPVVLSPGRAKPYRFETARARDDAALILQRAGVQVAIASGRTHELRNLRGEAGALVGLGMSAPAALAAISTVPAGLFGLADRLGVRAGKPPLFVLARGDLLGLDGQIAGVAVGGQLELEPRQR